MKRGLVFHGNNIAEQIDNLSQCFADALTLFKENPSQFKAIGQLAKQQRF